MPCLLEGRGERYLHNIARWIFGKYGLLFFFYRFTTETRLEEVRVLFHTSDVRYHCFSFRSDTK